MKKKYSVGIALLFTGLFTIVHAQNKWEGKLTLSSLDCENRKVCYALEIKNSNDNQWVLGDQNYRFFYDAENISVESVKSLLPSGYSPVAINDILELVGKGQEDFSPLDEIDENLGFLDFNIQSYSRHDPGAGVEMTSSYLPVAEICLDVSEELITETGEDYAVNIYFCRPSTAGRITRQYSVVSETAFSNETVGTQSSRYYDLNYAAGTDARLSEFCNGLTNTGELAEGLGRASVFPNPIYSAGMLNYQLEGVKEFKEHDIVITDTNNRMIKTWKDLPKGNSRIQLDGISAAGVYFLKIKTSTGVFYTEFILLTE